MTIGWISDSEIFDMITGEKKNQYGNMSDGLVRKTSRPIL